MEATKKIQVKVSVSYSSANTGKVRTVVTTDGEVDDMDSFMSVLCCILTKWTLQASSFQAPLIIMQVEQ